MAALSVYSPDLFKMMPVRLPEFHSQILLSLILEHSKWLILDMSSPGLLKSMDVVMCSPAVSGMASIITLRQVSCSSV